jgi:ribosome-binding ATPase
MGLSIGIIGLPNVGKSTIFNALTSAKAQSENYPFCTIEPNIGIVLVPDPRMQRIQDYLQRQKTIPAAIEIVDIAGLVKGASKGEGLGNKFLGNIRETDAVLAVVRCFDDPNVVHVDGDVDPLRDIEVIQLELIIADLDTMGKRLNRVRSLAKTGKVDAKAEFTLVERVIAHLQLGSPVRTMDLSADEHESLSSSHLLTAKPVLYCCNVGEDDLPDGNPYSQQVAAHAANEGSKVVVVCGKIEAELADLEEGERLELLDAYGLAEPALNALVREGYALLGLHAYFTAGEREIRAWTIPLGATAPQAAGAIHGDFERGFIRAQVYTLDLLDQYKSEQGIKEAGKLRTEGKDYVVRDGDIMHFLFNV